MASPYQTYDPYSFMRQPRSRRVGSLLERAPYAQAGATTLRAVRQALTAPPGPPAGAIDSDEPWRDVERGSQYAERAVQGYGERLRPEILRDIGSTLGGLNEIGALRSGRTTVELGEIGERYGSQVGAYAKEAALGGAELGRGVHFGGRAANLAEREQGFREEEAKRKRKKGFLSAIGGVLGAGLGFAVGGVPGAAVGSKVGSGAGGGG